MSGEQIAGFMKFAIASAQLVKIHAEIATDQLSSAIEQSLFGELPDESWSRMKSLIGLAPTKIRRRTHGLNDIAGSILVLTSMSTTSRHQNAARRPKDFGKKDNKRPSRSGFANVGPLLASITTSYCELVRSRCETGSRL
jgi:hypothetical protein